MIVAALATVALLGLGLACVGAILTCRFQRQAACPPRYYPPVTILKPLHGDELSLEEALTSFARIEYPQFQLVLGVQDPADPALAVVERVRQRFDNLDAVVVVDPKIHGLNRKVSNLINMLPSARHDILVFSDSDLHVSPDYLDDVVAALDRPGCGLVTSVCAGRGVGRGRLKLAARLGAMQVSHSFLPGVLLSRWLGRQDALGTTMAIRRGTLALAGGLDGLLPHLADDHVLGRQVRSLGLSIEIAAAVPVVSVTETSIGALWQHELRWARTIRALEPWVFLPSMAQFPLFWAMLACLLSGGAVWTLAWFGVVWLTRAVCAFTIDHALGTDGDWREAVLWPIRDVLSAALVIASFCGDRVVWRGHVMHADAGRKLAPPPSPMTYADAAE